MTKNRGSKSARSLSGVKKWSATTIAAVFVIEVGFITLNVSLSSIAFFVTEKIGESKPIFGFLFQFLLPSALTSYGVFFNDFVGNDCFYLHDALWTPIVFLASWNIISPWSRRICEHLEENGSKFAKYVSLVALLVAVTAVILSSFVQTQISQILSYGMAGGAGTGFIISHLRISTHEDFQSKPAIFDALCQIAKASSLFVIPHLILIGVEFYGTFQAQFLYAVFLLNVVPARLLISKRRKISPVSKLSRYKTIPGYLWNQDSIELPTINRSLVNNNAKLKNSPTTNNAKLSDTDSDSSSDSYTIEEVHEGEEELSAREETEHDSNAHSALARCKTEMGVEILPEIPEEDEIDEDQPTPKKLSVDVKRLSAISYKIEEVIDKTQQMSENSYLDATNLENCVGSRRKKFFFLKEMNAKSSACVTCCSPYQKYLFRRRTRILLDVVYDNLVKPLKTSLNSFYFLPALYGKTCVAVASVIYIIIIPHITLESGVNHKVDVTEATFLLTFIAVSWCFFLISLPWLISTTKARTTTLHVLGLLITSGSMFMLHLSLTHDMITLSCLVFGFGFGIVSYSEEVVHRESLGTRRWKKVRGTLDTLSGLFVIVTYLIIYLLELNVTTLFLLFSILIGVNTVLWMLAPLCKLIWTHCKKRNDRDTFLT